jgi:AcrR family transcriptional regulator
MTERRKRDPSDGRVVRGQSTRTSILEHAIGIFASRGFADVTTRELADAAGANQAAILYHFGGKEGLYLAVAELVADRARVALQSVLSGADAGTETDGRGAPAAAETLHVALRALTMGFITMAADGAATEFIVREQAHPGPAFDILYRRYIGDMHARISALVAEATGRQAGDRTAIVDAHALIGMALSFAVARATVLRRLGVSRYSAREAEAIAARVAELGCRSLGVTSGTTRPTRPTPTSRRSSRR